MCFMMAVGKRASADGSVMVARSCDSNSTEAQRVLSIPRQRYAPGTELKIPECAMAIPQVEETYAYTAISRVIDGETAGDDQRRHQRVPGERGRKHGRLG